jgi:hypothetical protein
MNYFLNCNAIGSNGRPVYCISLLFGIIDYIRCRSHRKPITVAVRWSETNYRLRPLEHWVVGGSNPTRGVDVCAFILCLCCSGCSGLTG